MIIRFHELPLKEVQPLREESKEEGFRFLQRLHDEWASGANRFDQNGEALFGYYVGSSLVAVAGINRQSPTRGRLRHFYVARGSRRKGIGRALLSHILSHATQFFDELVLHTDNVAADAFYLAAGFSPVLDSKDPSHKIDLKKRNPNEVRLEEGKDPGESATSGKAGGFLKDQLTFSCCFLPLDLSCYQIFVPKFSCAPLDLRSQTSAK